MIILNQGIRKDFSEYEHYCHRCGTQVKAEEKDLICKDLFLYYIICPTCHRYIWVPGDLISDETRANLDSALIAKMKQELEIQKAEHEKQIAKRRQKEFIEMFIALIVGFTVLRLVVWILN